MSILLEIFGYKYKIKYVLDHLIFSEN